MKIAEHGTTLAHQLAFVLYQENKRSGLLANGDPM